MLPGCARRSIDGCIMICATHAGSDRPETAAGNSMRKLKARGLHEHVIEEIGKRIVQGEFAAGKALPGEAQLCEMLGVSRTALREAMRVLASKGLVLPRRKIGTMVHPSEHWNYLDPQILSWLLESGES